MKPPGDKPEKTSRKSESKHKLLDWHQILLKTFTWNNAIRFSGLAGIGYQTVANNADRPTLLLLFGAMIGLPSFLPNGTKDKEP